MSQPTPAAPADATVVDLQAQLKAATQAAQATLAIQAPRTIGAQKPQPILLQKRPPESKKD